MGLEQPVAALKAEWKIGNMQRIEHILSGLPLFEGLAAEQLAGLVRVVTVRSADKGQMIFSEGTQADGFYIVAEGRIKVFRSSPDGREAVLHVLGPGEPFGEVAVFQGGTFPAHAMAVTPSRILFLPRRALVERIANDPAFALNMLAALSRKLRQFTHKVEALTLQETPQRLAAYLLHASELADGANTFRLDVTKGLLAGLLGTARETLSRCLSKLVERGVVSMDGRDVTILDRAALEAMSEGSEQL